MSKKEQLLIQTAKIIEEEGIQSLTIDYLAKKSGLTKGGVLYHFNSKRNLLIKMNEMIIEQFEQTLNQYKSTIEGEYVFTRAYAMATIHYLNNREHAFLPALLMTSLEEKDCLNLWEKTTERWEEQFKSDGDDEQKVLELRLICDGVWYSMMYNNNDVLNAQMEKLVMDHCQQLEGEYK